MTKPKRIFKVSYQIDFELFHERETGIIGTHWNVSTKKKIDQRNINKDTFGGDRYTDGLEYLDRHLAEEIEATVVWLAMVESSATRHKRSDSPWFGDLREQERLVLDKYKIGSAKRAKKRMDMRNGRPEKDKPSPFEKERLIEQWIQLLRDVHNRNPNKKLGPTALARAYYANEDRPQSRENLVRDLTDKFVSCEIDFKTLKSLAFPKNENAT